MSSCEQCESVLNILKGQIQELHERSVKLTVANECLMKEIDNDEEDEEKLIGWKSKYQEMVKINRAIEERLKKRKIVGLLSDQKYTKEPQRYYQSISPFMTSRTIKKENFEHKNKKGWTMSNLKENMVLEKAQHHKRSSSRQNMRRQSGTQIILRIVDDRLNRMY